MASKVAELPLKDRRRPSLGHQEDGLAFVFEQGIGRETVVPTLQQ
jgi:hypothetical protein